MDHIMCNVIRETYRRYQYVYTTFGCQFMKKKKCQKTISVDFVRFDIIQL